MANTGLTSIGSSNYIGVDIGGTNTRVGVFESLNAPDFIHLARFPTYQNYEEQLRHIIVAVRASNIRSPCGYRCVCCSAYQQKMDIQLASLQTSLNMSINHLPRIWLNN